MPLFGKSHKSPPEMAKNLKEALVVLEKGKKVDKASEEISKILSTMKNMLYGTQDQDPQPETVAQLSQEIYNNNLIYLLIKNLSKIDFESKKDVTQIVNNLLRRQIGTRFPTVEQICSKKEILTTLLNGYESQDIALNCGMMLRECIRHEPLARMIILSPEFYNFFTYVEVPTFDIASDAFSTFKDLLTRHKFLASEFLEANYDKLFGQYQQLLLSENYVTRRQSLKLLGELILDRHNFNVMTRYISNAENLKLMMNLLRDKSRNIQFEAFHVFKVFVANPNKTKPVADILLRNRDKLVDFLSKFQNDRTDDEQFNDEKAYLIKQIKELRPLPGPPGPPSTTPGSSTTPVHHHHHGGDPTTAGSTPLSSSNKNQTPQSNTPSGHPSAINSLNHPSSNPQHNNNYASPLSTNTSSSNKAPTNNSSGAAAYYNSDGRISNPNFGEPSTSRHYMGSDSKKGFDGNNNNNNNNSSFDYNTSAPRAI